MERLYRITVLTDEQDLRASLPEEMQHLSVLTYPFAGSNAYAWTFEEVDFHLIPRLREWLVRQAAQHVSEEGLRRYSEQDSLTAKLVRLSGGQLEGVEVIEAEIFDEDRCSDCGLAVPHISATPHLHIRLPKGEDAALFWVNSTTRIYVASEEFLQAMQKAGLVAGLSTFAVEAEGVRNKTYVGLFANSALGWPAAPYGLAGETCPTCGRPGMRSPQAKDTKVYPALPRYSFYLTYDHPAQDASWMWTDVYGQSVLLMTSEVRDWLHAPETLTGRDHPKRKPLNFHPLGWYPDERDTAFLDEKYR